MKLYPQSISGVYRKRKDLFGLLLLVIYFGFSWIRWERAGDVPDQAIMIDLANRKAYLFWIEIWPDELYYLTGVMILGAIGLFFVTSLYGRIWCGYTCPHTVFVDIFFKIEKFFQGDRNVRIKLDNAEWDADKYRKKILTHFSWLLVGFSFAFGWVCYFYDAPELVMDLLNFEVSYAATMWLIGLTFSTYFFAGFIRDKVCVYMCPYGRFQSAFLDNDSSIVTYQDWRGEPRGNSKQNPDEYGDCIDCGKCVYVCPMGIDIREGLQIACIGCGLCVDACDSVMEKLDRPKGLISYDSVNSSLARKTGGNHNKKLFHFKTILFAAIFVIVSAALLYTLSNKSNLEFNILGNRQAMFTILPDGSIRNTYTLKIRNKTNFERTFEVKVSGVDNYLLKTYGNENYAENLTLKLKAEQEKDAKLFIKTKEKLVNERNRIKIILIDKSSGEIYEKSSQFITNR